MTLLYLGICIGIILSYLFLRFVEPIFTLLLDVYQVKQTDVATKYQLNSQKQSILFLRKFPEAQMNQQQELTPAIGFSVMDSGDFDCDYEDKIKKVGF